MEETSQPFAMQPVEFQSISIGKRSVEGVSLVTATNASVSADSVTYSVPSTERLLNAKHFSRLPPKSVARQEALWQDTLREGSVRALCQGREYNSSGLTCHLKEAVRARNSIDLQSP